MLIRWAGGLKKELRSSEHLQPCKKPHPEVRLVSGKLILGGSKAAVGVRGAAPAAQRGRMMVHSSNRGNLERDADVFGKDQQEWRKWNQTASGRFSKMVDLFAWM